MGKFFHNIVNHSETLDEGAGFESFLALFALRCCLQGDGFCTPPRNGGIGGWQGCSAEPWCRAFSFVRATGNLSFPLPN